MNPPLSRRLGAVLGTRTATPQERRTIARAAEAADSWRDLPPDVQTLVEEIEARPVDGGGKKAVALVAAAGHVERMFSLYGVPDLDGHEACNIAEFCRNPLHPGPCKGWKHTLRAVAPGLHRQMEQTRLDRVQQRRAERAAAAVAEGKKAPRLRPLAHERPQGVTPPVPTPDQPPVSDARRKRIDAADAKIRKTGPRDGDGDGKLNEGKYVKKGDNVGSTRTEDGKGGGVEPKPADAHSSPELNRMRSILKDPEADDYDLTKAAEKLSPADLRAMTDDERNELRKEMNFVLDRQSADPKHLTDDVQNKARARRVVVALSNATGKGTPQGGGGEFKGGGKTVAGTEKPTPGPDEPVILKGPAQRANLRAVLNAGSAGYDNKRGFLNGRDKKDLIDKGLAEQLPDGRLRITDKGRASHEASIPRRNGEEIGFDGKTASERQAHLEATQGEERKKLEAQAKELFRAGIPSPRPAALLGGPNALRGRDATRKMTEAIRKDLGENVEDYRADVGPLAQDWIGKVRAVDDANRYRTTALQRSNWLLAAQKADPANAAEYAKLHEENKAEFEQARADTTAAVQAAEDARQTLGAAIIARYQAKGKRKTLAGLKLPEARQEAVVNDMPASERRIRSAVDHADGVIKGLDHNLEPWQVSRAQDVRNEYTAAIVDQEKANAALDEARNVAGDARRARDEHFRKPSLLRQGPEGEQETARINAEMQRTGALERVAEERKRHAQDRARTADATLVDSAQNLRVEQARNGGPRKETDVERMQRQRGEARSRVAEQRRILDAGLRAGGRKAQLAEAKRLGVEVPRGEKDDALVKRVLDAHMDERLHLDPPGAAGRTDLDPDVREELYRQAKANAARYDAGHNEEMASHARDVEQRGMIPYSRAVAAQTVASRRGADVRSTAGHDAIAQLIGLPARPKGTGPRGLTTEADMTNAGWTKHTVKRKDLRAGDLAAGMQITATEEDSRGKVGLQGLGVLGMDVERPEDGGRETVVWRPPGGEPTPAAETVEPTPDPAAGVPRGVFANGTDVSDKVAAALQADQIGDGFFRAGNNPYDKLQAEYGELGARDGVLTQMARDQGWTLPARGSVDEALNNANGGTELFRGVRPGASISAEQQLTDMRDNPDFAYGSGIYGNGIYFSVDSRVADAFAHHDPDAPRSATDEGRTVRVALHADARVITMKKLDAERKKWFEANAEKVKANPGLNDWIYDNGRFATMLGYDAMRVDGQDDGYRIHQPGSRKPKHSKATQYVIFNRGALTMEAG